MAPQATAARTEPRAPALVSVDGRTYPLRSAELRGRAEGGLAHSTLVQEFQNPHDQPLEVLYTMPLPADGAVLGYTIRMGERIIRGEIESREKAEASYRKALYEGRTAGLLEEDRADTFQQRLGNVPPRTDVRVEIDVLHPLSFLPAAGSSLPLWEYRFPTVVGVRYEGAPGRVGDAGRLDPDRASPDEEAGGISTRMALALTVADLIEGTGGITSTTHEIRCEQEPGGAHVALRGGARLNRDLVLRWAAAAGEVGARVAEGGGLPGDGGRYALLTITPPALPAASFRRDLTVLLDASGSMDGKPLETAKRVIEDLLRSLDPGDRFEVWKFASEPARVSKGVEDVSAYSVEGCIRAVRSIRADGGTEMTKAVEEALKPLRRDSQRQIILVTDGMIGFESEVLRSMVDSLPPGVRVHAVGIGAAPNRTLTKGVARAGRGTELFASDEESAAEAARRLRSATVRPLLTELTIGGSALLGAAPNRPPDVFAGRPVVLSVELRRSGEARSRVRTLRSALPSGWLGTWPARRRGARAGRGSCRPRISRRFRSHPTHLPIPACAGPSWSVSGSSRRNRGRRSREGSTPAT